MEKPRFEHPQSQSSFPPRFQPSSLGDQSIDIAALYAYIDTRIATHIHNGGESQRINYNTDIIGIPTSIYAGYVNSDGTAGNLPTGWTSSKTGTGQYTITHNLNTAKYTANATAYATVAFPKYNAVNVNDVQFVWLTDTATLTDTRFYFTLVFFN